MSEQWFIVRDNQKHGPYSAAALRRMATNGQLLPIDLVMREGMARPVPATQIKGLFAQPDTPPPLPTQPAPPQLPEATPPSSGPVASADNAEPGFLSMIFRLWPRLKFWEKATGIGLLLVVLAVYFWANVLQPATGGSKSWWEILLGSSVLASVISGVFLLLSKFIGSGKNRDMTAGEPERRAGGLGMKGHFVGLDGSQWLFTLHVAFLSCLVGAVVAGLLFGSVSLWVHGSALAVVGILIAWLSHAAEQNVRKGNVPKELVLSKYLGLSTLPPALLALLCGCFDSSPLGRVGQYAVWIYFVYGVLVGLPSIHVLQWVGLNMSPIRRYTGVFISGGYLAAVFIAGVVISSTLNQQKRGFAVSDEVRASLLGTWEEATEPRPFASGRKTKIEFTKGGQALVSNWHDRDHTEDYKYRFESSAHLILFEDKGGHEFPQGSVELLSGTEIVVKLSYANKKFTKAGQTTARTPTVSAEVAETFKNKLAGEWSKVTPTKRRAAEYTKQTVFFGKTGTIRYSGTMLLFTGSESDENDSGKFEVIDENKIRVGDQTISFDFTSEDEFIAQCFNRAFGRFQEVDGKFRRVKPFDSGKLKQQIVGRWAATFPDGTLSFEFDTAGNATVGYPGQRPLQNTFTITDNTIRIRHLGSDSILTLTVVSIFDNEATFKVQGANDTVFRRMK